MTAYSTIADSEIDPESPGTTTLFGKLRNNPLAIQENDATAPEVVYATTAGTVTGQGALAILSSVSHSEISFGSTTGSFSASTGATVIPEGFHWLYHATSGATLAVQVNVTGTFITVGTIDSPVFCYSDGANMRINNSSGSSRTISYRRL